MNNPFQMPRKTPTVMAVCCPGEQFSLHWVAAWTMLLPHLLGKFGVAPNFGHNSNVHITRQRFLEGCQTSDPAPDYALWIDDDNLLDAQQFDMLYQDLQERPEIDAVVGWCYCQRAEQIAPQISCGRISEQGWCEPIPYEELMSGPDDLKEMEYSGFPVVLMRASVLEKAGPNPFVPLVGEQYAFGMSGEDTAFWIHARERGGCRLFVDRRVKVPHLKLMPAEPGETDVARSRVA